MHKVAMPALTVFMVATLCIPGSAFAYSAVFVDSVPPQAVASDYSYISSDSDFEFEKQNISEKSDVRIIDGLRITFGGLSDGQVLGTMYLRLFDLTGLDGKTVSLSAAPASDPSAIIAGSSAVVSGGSVATSVNLNSSSDAWLIYMTVRNVTSSVYAVDVSFYLEADVSDSSGQYSTVYSATGAIVMDLEIIIHPTDKDGSKDVAEAINDSPIGVTGSIDKQEKTFKSSESGGVSGYPSAYIEHDSSHNVGTAGKEFDVTFMIPAGLMFGIRLKVNHMGTTTITLTHGDATESVEYKDAFGDFESMTYVGKVNNKGDLKTDDRNILWLQYDEPVIVNAKGTMGADWILKGSFKVEVYMKPTTTNS